MRRVFSISMIAVLLCSLVSPVWADSCESMEKQQPTCQRHQVVHHCGMMGHMHDEITAPETSGTISGNAPKCPMACCTQATISGAVNAARYISPEHLAECHDFHFHQTVFASAGFSSHTDRGPPLA